MLNKINTNKLFKPKFYNPAIETKNKILFFDFIYNLFITKFETFRKYLNNNLKKKLSYFFRRLQRYLLCSLKKNTKIYDCA